MSGIKSYAFDWLERMCSNIDATIMRRARSLIATADEISELPTELKDELREEGLYLDDDYHSVASSIEGDVFTPNRTCEQTPVTEPSSDDEVDVNLGNGNDDVQSSQATIADAPEVKDQLSLPSASPQSAYSVDDNDSVDKGFIDVSKTNAKARKLQNQKSGQAAKAEAAKVQAADKQAALLEEAKKRSAQAEAAKIQQKAASKTIVPAKEEDDWKETGDETVHISHALYVKSLKTAAKFALPHQYGTMTQDTSEFRPQDDPMFNPGPIPDGNSVEIGSAETLDGWEVIFMLTTPTEPHRGYPVEGDFYNWTKILEPKLYRKRSLEQSRSRSRDAYRARLREREEAARANAASPATTAPSLNSQARSTLSRPAPSSVKVAVPVIKFSDEEMAYRRAKMGLPAIPKVSAPSELESVATSQSIPTSVSTSQTEPESVTTSQSEPESLTTSQSETESLTTSQSEPEPVSTPEANSAKPITPIIVLLPPLEPKPTPATVPQASSNTVKSVAPVNRPTSVASSPKPEAVSKAVSHSSKAVAPSFKVAVPIIKFSPEELAFRRTKINKSSSKAPVPTEPRTTPVPMSRPKINFLCQPEVESRPIFPSNSKLQCVPGEHPKINFSVTMK